ncbi:Asp-tRNA(Asn)/Glu-tRNA(Gln) amidotransferase subunit GatB [Patescibacteria group bacterium]|nr:Asp-tRNA(Asn)/Glu-tRNA(Gln) amidotransferase subunit GatB [Patescibacteria group bacterium]MBU1519262.1 Asp-tRNA(Asn)/Glu-tRNA(Gln) amidotransferase subunit GatB [Patescibacteria group bacterium]MBU1730052.1 Asp-tRNA(Asn)/Glu-tRNA(Gln) amidotransferase subunit GatB [Patescibacteria group bacterium]MBU1956418.1 Asp-tRNA(Asn)/Glu-tRNA(Gln) amidotransferase subunit GatB [Patescibacteria group bacterium]
MSKNYTATIGLEIHAELKTQTKMFCGCRNNQEETRPNINVCPVCMAHPGTLPVINKEAVKCVLKVGKALGGNLADFTEFDRKNYFYPDIPKGYQISQYKHPLITGGVLNNIAITRIHLEEDTARSQHNDETHSLVDFNRGGLPLMELVTEPVITNAKDAVSFAKELQLALRYLDVSDANMEKGQMRVEANISVSKTNELGTKVEVKNLNSFRSVEGSIEYEKNRQISILEAGERVVQETRGWDENKSQTFSQRKKENSDDYRYFPDPDLPKLKLSEIKEFNNECLEKEIPTMPWEKRTQYKKLYNIKDEDIDLFIQTPKLAKFFEDTALALDNSIELITRATNYLVSDFVALLKENGWEKNKITSKYFAGIVKLAYESKISSRVAKDLIITTFKDGQISNNPQKDAETKGLLQKSDENELYAIIEAIKTENPAVVEDYRKGKISALQFLIGQGMKKTQGSANPQVLKQLFEKACD